MRRKNATSLSGAQLVADFQQAWLSFATAENARYEATNSENSVLGYLQASSSGGYLNPHAFSDSAQQNITRASIDAHIKKVQAAQLTALSRQQLEQLTAEDQTSYGGHKVQVTMLDRTKNPIEVIWFNPYSGYRSNPYNRKTLTAYIDEVLLDRNILFLRPSYAMKLVNRELQGYAVYITDPETLQPLVNLNLV